MQSVNDGVVDVWAIDLQVPDETLRRAYEVLSDDELKRAQRFRFPVDSRRFVIARSALRKILADYLHASPKQLVFEYSAYGKPKLATPAADLRFNLSRSHEKALIACTRSCEVGVDIEWLGRTLAIDDLAQRFFSSGENDKLRTFPPEDRHHVFLECWTLKEAFVKGVGKGLSIGLDTFDVSQGLGGPNLGRSVPNEPFVVNGWSLTTFAINELEGYVSAVATEGENLRINVRAWAE
jgi:4'-phosphopantetheinyl transferase